MNTIVAFIEDRRLGLAAIGAVAIVVGSILPWIRVPQAVVGVTTGYGLQDDGKVTVVLGACGSSGPPKVAATVEGSAIPADRVERLTTQWINSQSNQALNDKGVQLDRKQAAKALSISYRALLYKIRDAGLPSNRAIRQAAEIPPKQEVAAD